MEAVYEDWVTTISSGGERPLLLAEGAFSPDARLELAQRPEPVDGAAAYDYQITDGAELPDTVTLRVCADGLRGSVRAALLQDGSARPIEAERDGSYLVLTAPTAGTLLLSASGSGTLLPWVLGRRGCGGTSRPAVPPPQTEKNKRSCLCLGQNSAPWQKPWGAVSMLQQQKKGAAGEHEQPGGSPPAQPLTEYQAGKANRH